MDELATEPTSQSSRRQQLTGIRRMIADRMAYSHREIPGVHVVEEMDLTHVSLQDIVAVAAAAVARTISAHPMFNAHVENEQVVLFDRCDLGIAVDTDRGLMVPVVRDCGNKDVDTIRGEVAELAGRARAGRLTQRDVSGATVTLTSPGKRGGVLATPLINPPQTAIIGVHRAVPRVVVRNGAMVTRTIANLTVTFDHRVIDGAEAGDFALTLARTIGQGQGSDGDRPD